MVLALDTAPAMTPGRDASPALLRDYVGLVDEKHDQGHSRLRHDLRELERELEQVRRECSAMRDKVTALAVPPDASKLRFPLPLVILIVGGFLTLGAGIWSFRIDVLNQLAQAQVRSENNARLMDQMYAQLKDQIKTLDQQQRLQYAEFQTFRQEMARRTR